MGKLLAIFGLLISCMMLGYEIGKQDSSEYWIKLGMKLCKESYNE